MTTASSVDRTLDAEHIALYVMLALFSVLGVTGNALAFYIFFTRRNSGTSVIFILALAGTDFITCLVTVPYTIVFEALRYNLHYDWLCKLYMFFITSTIPYSSFIMAGIAFDRYFCICHPFLHVLNVQRARIVVLCMALPAFTFGLITAMLYGMYEYKYSLVVNGTVFMGTNISVETIDYQTFQMVNVSDLSHDENVFLGEIPMNNDSQRRLLYVHRLLLRNDQCYLNGFYFTQQFQEWFLRVYTSCYLLSFITVMILYILIYKFIYTHRALKSKRRRKNNYTSVANTETYVLHQTSPAEAETALTEVNGNGTLLLKTSIIGDNNVNNTAAVSDSAGKEGSTATSAAVATDKANSRKNSGENTGGENSRAQRRRGSTVRDRNLYANIKTAMMLFVVTLVFILAFAPVWFMVQDFIPVQLNVFYMYFVYNVANPFIYAFMNQAFRQDLKKLLRRS